MMIFEDILTDEKVEKITPPAGVELQLLGKPLVPTLLEFNVHYSDRGFKSIEVSINLDNSDEIEHVRPIFEDFDYSSGEIKSRVFTRIPVTLTWRAKAEVLAAYTEQLLPFSAWETLAAVKNAAGQAVLLNLDDSYDFGGLEA